MLKLSKYIELLFESNDTHSQVSITSQKKTLQKANIDGENVI